MLHTCTYIPVPCKNKPRCASAVDRLEVVDKETVLLRAHSEVVFSTHHHKVNGAKIESIPKEESGNQYTNKQYFHICSVIIIIHNILLTYTICIGRSSDTSS